MSTALIQPATNPTNTAVLTNATEDIYDIRPPVTLPFGLDQWLIGALVLALAAAAVAFWIWRRRRQRPATAPALRIPPHVRARDRLRRALDLISRPEPFCVLVSDTLRLYLEERFELRAPERTTEEFLVELQATPRLTPPQKAVLGDFLSRCDLVKFARHEPSEPELRELLDCALQLVDETAPTALERGEETLSKVGAERAVPAGE